MSPRSASGRARGQPDAGATRNSFSKGNSIGESTACPGVSSVTRDRPWSSTSWWIFVDNPPRERSMACSGGSPPGFLKFDPAPREAGGVRRVLMGARDRRVDRQRPVDQLRRVRSSGQFRVDAVVGAVIGRASMPGHIVCHGPYTSGKSRQATPAR